MGEIWTGNLHDYDGSHIFFPFSGCHGWIYVHTNVFKKWAIRISWYWWAYPFAQSFTRTWSEPVTAKLFSSVHYTYTCLQVEADETVWEQDEKIETSTLWGVFANW